MSNGTYVYKRNYAEFEEKERKFLDSISDKELLSFFEKGKELYDIMEEIEDAYGESYTEEEYIFNWLDKYDFEEYLIKRFPNIIINHILSEEQLIIG